MSKILITGGLGFIGARLSRLCLERGHEVRILDNGFRGRADRLEDHLSHVELIEGDVCDFETARKACRGMDWVFHLAAINGTRYFYEIPHEVLRVNVKGMMSIVEAAQREKCKRLLFSSSSELYHYPDVIPTPETVKISIPDVKNARFSYAGSKLIGELLCLHQDPKYKISSVIIRYHNVYGPKMGCEHVIPEIFRKMKEATSNFSKREAKIEIQGTGSETRAFCYVDDAVEGTLIAMKKGEDREIYHIGTQEEISIKDLIELMAKVLKVQLKIQAGPLTPGSTERRCPDIGKLRDLAYRPRVSLEEGLNRTLESYLGEPQVTAKGD